MRQGERFAMPRRIRGCVMVRAEGKAKRLIRQA